MAGVKNNTAKQFNIKVMTKATKDRPAQRVKVMIAPGFNVFVDEHWNAVKNDEYVKSLKDQGLIEFGARVEDLILDMDPMTKAKSKMEPAPTKGKKKKALEEEEEEDL